MHGVTFEIQAVVLQLGCNALCAPALDGKLKNLFYDAFLFDFNLLSVIANVILKPLVAVWHSP